ncbi:MAG: hypothetical protein ACLP8S_14440 [Solirubrobacteraceae bacterium]|jgi:hypothetical protein
MTVLALIGAKALYLLFIWLLSAAGAARLAERKGYGERVGLTFGLLLSLVGFLIVLILLPGRPGSAWKRDGIWPRKRHRADDMGDELGSSSGFDRPIRRRWRS